MIDAIVVWPNNCDYPLFRKLISEIRGQFKQFFIVFTRSNDIFDRENFVRGVLSKYDITFLRQSSQAGDWRHIATHDALAQSTSSRVLFLEQDFLIYNPTEFFQKIKANPSDAIGFKHGDRLHPAFLLVKKEVLAKTHQDFAPDNGVYDHYGRIQTDFDRLGVSVTWLQDIGLLEEKDWFHLNGLSHNLYLLQRDLPVTYKPEILKSYLRSCLTAGVPLPIDFPVLYERLKGELQ